MDIRIQMLDNHFMGYVTIAIDMDIKHLSVEHIIDLEILKDMEVIDKGVWFATIATK